METIIKFELPLKRLAVPDGKWRKLYPRRVRWFGWLFLLNTSGMGEFGGSRTNRRYHLSIFRWHIVTVHRNEYHDASDNERAQEYLNKWSECEKELKMFRLAALGKGVDEDVKRVIKESLGVDLDEGTIR